VINMIRKFISSKKVGRRLTEYRTFINKKNLFRDEVIGGLRVSISDLEGKDPSFRAYLLQKGYENFFIAVNRSRIPIMTIYYIHNNKSGIYILTKARDEEELDRNIRIIETSFYAVFPKSRLTRLSGSEIKNILSFSKTKLTQEKHVPMINYRMLNGTYENHDTLPPFRIPVLDDGHEDSIQVGKIISQFGEEEYNYSIKRTDLARHVVCLGVTGSGKTTTVATIINKLFKDINYIILDFHNEYKELLENYHMVIKPGVDDEYAINPLKPIDGVDLSEHLAMVTDIFADTYDFTHPQSYMFKRVLENTIHNYRYAGEKEPNLVALAKLLEKAEIKSYYDIETKMALIRRIKPLTEGQARKAFVGKTSLPIDTILRKNVIVELGGLRETKLRQIYSQLLLKQIYDYRILEGPQSLKHIIVIEEASYIVPYRRDFEKPTIAERMVNEMRKFGESIILVTQFPSQIPKDTIKNAGLLLIHRIAGQEDLRILQSILPLSISQIDYLKRLDKGVCVVKDPTSVEPYLVRIYPYIRNQGKKNFKSPFLVTNPSQST